jgi:monoterpene epsilon-lactone hydrolase
MAGLQSTVTGTHTRAFRRIYEMIDPAVPPGDLRQEFDKASRKIAKMPSRVKTSAVKAGLVTAEWLEPQDHRAHRVIVYLRGGSYVFGSIETHRSVAARIAVAAKARALIVDYRAAPEHPFPAPIEDVLEAYRWLLRNSIDPRGMTLVGDQAGGGLAIAAAMALRDARLPLPAAVVGLSPWTDLAFGGWSLLNNQKREQILTLDALLYGAHHYLNGETPTNPLASPLYGDFRGLPPMLLHTGAHEILRDDATRTAHVAENAGVDVSVEVWDGMPHFFHQFPKLEEGQAAVSRVGSFIQSRTERPPIGARSS